jgi:hypothetical protein
MPEVDSLRTTTFVRCRVFGFSAVMPSTFQILPVDSSNQVPWMSIILIAIWAHPTPY